jgi:hypothetical protein
MKSETAWEKSCAVCFFGESKEKAHSKQSGWSVAAILAGTGDLRQYAHGKIFKAFLSSIIIILYANFR